MTDSSATCRRVLVVDDDRQIHADFRKVLVVGQGEDRLSELAADVFGDQPPVDANAHLEVVDVFQGFDALSAVDRAIRDDAPFDVAFVDMRMPPGWDGLETIERLWEVDPQLQVVICTAYSDHPWSEVIERLGQRDNLLILKKPFDSAEVTQLVVALSEKRRLAQAVEDHMNHLEKRVEERTAELSAAREEAERLLAAISSVLIGLDSDARVTRWNATAESIFTLPAANAIGKRFGDLGIEWNDPEEVVRLLSERSTSAVTRRETTFRDASGRMRSLGLSIYTVAVDGQLTGQVVVGLDMTEWRELEHQYQQAQRLESIGQLAAGIAHEINTPMQCVSGNVEFLKGCYDSLFNVVDTYRRQMESDEHKSWRARRDEMTRLISDSRFDFIRDQAPAAIEEAADAVHRVIDIVRAMRAMSHPGTNQMAPVDVNELVHSAATISRNRWKYTARLVLNLDTSLGAIDGLPAELSQVILNLIVNAADAIAEYRAEAPEDEGVITVSTRQAQDGVVIDVQDTGGGIPDDIKHRVFDPFFTTKDVGQGTGQGLALTHDVVVNMHGGRITLETAHGKGTTFSVWLPGKQCAPSAGSS